MNRRKAYFIAGALIVVAAAMFAFYRLKVPPYPQIVQSIKMSPLYDKERWTTIPDRLDAVDVRELIRVNSVREVEDRRLALYRLLWGSNTLPNRLPNEFVEDIQLDPFSNYAGVMQLSKIVVEMEYGLTSDALLFTPSQPSKTLVIYHQGHRGGFELGKSEIEAFLEEGHSVLAFSMPLLGTNSRPTINIAHLGPTAFTSHEHFKLLEGGPSHPLRFFIEPVIVALNQLQTDYREIVMTGISGGGWTTILAAAMDPRIALSVPVAGSYPMFLRSGYDADWGDYEQTSPGLLMVANYLDLYIMGATGPGRRQLQIFNRYDPCCFNGLRSSLYSATLSRHVEHLDSGGSFKVVIDDTHFRHAISDLAIERVLLEIRTIGGLDR